MKKPDSNRDDKLPGDTEAMLLEAGAPVAPGTDRAARIKQRLMERVRLEPAIDPAALRTIGSEAGEWTEPMPGNHVKVLSDDGQMRSLLVRLEPGTTFPAHFHPEDEETYVIEGAVSFGDIGLKAGDYHLARKGSKHGEAYTEQGCLIFVRTADFRPVSDS